jgi:phosphate/sulfate permease
VANAIGPLAAIYGVIDSGGLIGSKSALPVSILLVGGAGIVFGLVTYGHKVTIFCLANNDSPSKIGETTKVEQLQPSPSIVTVEFSMPASSFAWISSNVMRQISP